MAEKKMTTEAYEAAEHKMMVKACKAANRYYDAYYSGDEDLGQSLGKEIDGIKIPIVEICEFMENKRKQTEREIWEFVNLDVVGGIVTSYFDTSPFCADTRNYAFFNDVLTSIAYFTHYNKQSAENKNTLDEIEKLTSSINFIARSVRDDEKFLKDSIVELNTPLYETYHGRIIFSGNTVCQVVVEYLGMSYFTDRSYEYEVIKERRDHLLTLVENL
jgi:hypothetical protein